MAVLFLESKNNIFANDKLNERFEFNNFSYKLDNFRSIFESFYAKIYQISNLALISFNKLIEFFSNDEEKSEKFFLDVYFLDWKDEKITAIRINSKHNLYSKLYKVYFNFINKVYEELNEKEKDKYRYKTYSKLSIMNLISDKINHLDNEVKESFIIDFYNNFKSYMTDKNDEIKYFNQDSETDCKNCSIIEYYFADYLNVVNNNLFDLIEEKTLQNIIDSELEGNNRSLKLFIYFVLSSFNQVKLPWGALTGIRPSFVASQLIDKLNSINNLQNKSERGSAFFCKKFLQNIYFVNAPKADLATNVALRERDLLRDVPSDIYCVYIHIPFCTSRCSYCSFPAKDGIDCDMTIHKHYLDCLLYELRLFFDNFYGKIFSIYIGGGTPSVFDEDLLRYFLYELNEIIDLKNVEERNFEAGRLDSLNKNKIKIIADSNFDRICINPQTMHEETLRKINRFGDLASMKELIDSARSSGIKSINSDLIAGLPGERPSDFYNSVLALLGLNVDTITLHSLALKRNSNLFASQNIDRYRNSNGDEICELASLDDRYSSFEESFLQATNLLESKGYNPYYLYRNKFTIEGLENVSFSKEGHYCLYNILMMNDRTSVIGFGAGAMSKKFEKENITRLATAATVNHYLSKFREITERKIEFFE